MITGFVNAHTHLELTFDKPIPRGPSMGAWLKAVVDHTRDPAHSAVEARRARIREGVRQLKTSNTICVGDISSDGLSLEELDRAGLWGVVALEFFGLNPDTLNQRFDAICAQYTALKEKWAAHPRLRVGLSPHAPYNVHPELWCRLVDELKPPLVHAHVAECDDERRWLAGDDTGIDALHTGLLGCCFRPEPLGQSPVGFLKHHGLLKPPLMLAHAVDVSAEEVGTIAAAGVAVVHCPRSNLFLHGGTLDWASYQPVAHTSATPDTPLPIALGTDSPLSLPPEAFTGGNFPLDIRAEARTAMAIHGWTEAQALHAMTLGGARALGFKELVTAYKETLAVDPTKLRICHV